MAKNFMSDMNPGCVIFQTQLNNINLDELNIFSARFMLVVDRIKKSSIRLYIWGNIFDYTITRFNDAYAAKQIPNF